MEEIDKSGIMIKVDGFSDEEKIQKASIEASLTKGKRVLPNLFIEQNDRIRIEIDILSDPLTGKILSVYKKDSFPFGELGEILVKTEEWFDFSIPTYEEVSLYRQKSAKYQNKETVIDNSLFRNFILGLHLKDWSLKDKKGDKIELKFDADETLDKESVSFINKVPTIIWDIVLTAFERETLIM